MAHSSLDEDTSDTGCPPPCASTTSQTGRQDRLLWSELVPSGVQGVCWWGSGESEQEEGASCLSCHDSSMTELCYIMHVQRHTGKNTFIVDHSGTTFSSMLVTNIIANVWIFPRGRIFMLIKIMTLWWGHSMCLTLINSGYVNTLHDTTVETDFKNRFYANSSRYTDKHKKLRHTVFIKQRWKIHVCHDSTPYRQ